MTLLLILPKWHYTQLRIFASLMAFPQSALFLDLSFKFLNSAFINTCFYSVPPNIPSRYSHLIYTFPLSTSFLLGLTDPRPQYGFLPICSFFYGDRLSHCRPTPNLEGQSTVFTNPGAGWSSYTPRQRVTILVAFYGLHELHGDYSFPRSPNGDSRTFIPIILNGDISPTTSNFHEAGDATLRITIEIHRSVPGTSPYVSVIIR
jgi:hypothetical protein